MKPRFKFYEIVRIKDTDFTQENKINGLIGTVLGMAEDESGRWGYAIHIYRLEEVWDLTETVLESTKTFTSKEEFYDGTSIHVKVDSKTGKGDIETN